MATVRITSGDDDDMNDVVAPDIDKNHVKVTKDSLGKKMAKAMVSESAKDVGYFLLFEVLIPGFKRGVSNAVNFALYGSQYSRSNSNRPYGYSGNTSYRNYYMYGSDRYYDDYDDYDYDPPSYRRRDRERRERSKYPTRGYYEQVDYKHISLPTEQEAMDIIDYMRAKIERKGYIYRAEFLNALKLPFSHVDYDFGWDDPDDIGYLMISPNEWLLDLGDCKEARYFRRRPED